MLSANTNEKIGVGELGMINTRTKVKISNRNGVKFFMKKRLIMFFFVTLLALLLAVSVLAACDKDKEECDDHYVTNPVTSVSVRSNQLRWESDATHHRIYFYCNASDVFTYFGTVHRFFSLNEIPRHISQVRIQPIGTNEIEYQSTFIKIKHEITSDILVTNVRVSENFLAWDYFSNPIFPIATVICFYVDGNWQRSTDQWGNSMHIPFIPSAATAIRITPNTVGTFDEETDFSLTLTHNPPIHINIQTGAPTPIITRFYIDDQWSHAHRLKWESPEWAHHVFSYQNGEWTFLNSANNSFFLPLVPRNASRLRIVPMSVRGTFNPETNVLTISPLASAYVQLQNSGMQLQNITRFSFVLDNQYLWWESINWDNEIYFYQNGTWNFLYIENMKRFRLSQIPSNATRMRIWGTGVQAVVSGNILTVTHYQPKYVDIINNNSIVSPSIVFHNNAISVLTLNR